MKTSPILLLPAFCLSGCLALAASMLNGCAEDPYIAYIKQKEAMIDQMPDGPDKFIAYQNLAQEINQERRTRALERIAEPQPTPWINPFPTPIQVQIVPSP